jgi:uncharacterized glyoxalase superfamily protein PhnB
MPIKRLVPILICDNITACADFYVHRLGFRITFNHETYVGLEFDGNGSKTELGIMRSSSETPAYNGKGVVFGFEVHDVDAQYERLSAEGVPFIQAPKDNPWGDRSCICIDPAGMAVYIYTPCEPSEEYRSSFV